VIALGESVDLGGCVNTPIRCTRCGRTGELSERTKEADRG